MKLSGRDFLIVLVVLAIAVWAGVWIAGEAVTLPIVVGGIFFCVIVAQVSPVGFNPLVLGLLIAGYILGNRGFAQFSVSANLPLFPAELGIAATLAVLVWRCAQERKLPWRNDFLNWALILWMAVCTVRLPFDVKTYGAMALRDYAMVYYALFFFVAQEALASDAAWRWVRRCVLASTAALPMLYWMSLLWPAFFLETLTVRGLPLIYFKGDLAGTFMSVGALAWAVFAFGENRRVSSSEFLVRSSEWHGLPARVVWRNGRSRSGWRMFGQICGGVISLGLVAAMLATDNRAAMLALIAGVVVMLIGGRWKFAVTLVGAGVVAVVAILFWAQVTATSWEKTPLYGFSQRVVSVVDFQGSGNYSAAEGAESKGDNNKFRAIWWKTVVDETMTANPWTGLGYGHDLAEAFLRAYYADSDDAFTARSPHNLLLSIFARTGVVGLAAFLILCAVMCGRTWRAARGGSMGESPMPPDPHGRVARATRTEWQGEAWCFVWAIFVSACLGVVLEGPMGAVVFWVLLGAGSARGTRADMARPATCPRQASGGTPDAARETRALPEPTK